MPKGSMWDSGKDCSNDVGYKFSETKEGYIVSVIPNFDWINNPDRLFPIFIDPSLKKVVSENIVPGGIQDTYIRSNNLDEVYEGLERISVGQQFAGQEFKSYMKIVKFPEFKHGEIVTNAKLDLRLYNFYTSAANRVGIRNIKSPYQVRQGQIEQFLQLKNQILNYGKQY